MLFIQPDSTSIPLTACFRVQGCMLWLWHQQRGFAPPPPHRLLIVQMLMWCTCRHIFNEVWGASGLKGPQIPLICLGVFFFLKMHCCLWTKCVALTCCAKPQWLHIILHPILTRSSTWLQWPTWKTSPHPTTVLSEWVCFMRGCPDVKGQFKDTHAVRGISNWHCFTHVMWPGR